MEAVGESGRRTRTDSQAKKHRAWVSAGGCGGSVEVELWMMRWKRQTTAALLICSNRPAIHGMMIADKMATKQSPALSQIDIQHQRAWTGSAGWEAHWGLHLCAQCGPVRVLHQLQLCGVPVVRAHIGDHHMFNHWFRPFKYQQVKCPLFQELNSN